MSPRPPRISLVSAFSALSLLIVVAVGALVVAALHGQIERRALSDATRLAQVAAQVGLQSHLRPSDLERELTPGRVASLRRTLDADLLRASGIQRVKVFDATGRIAFSDDERLIGQRPPDAHGVHAALAGSQTAEVEAGTGDDGRGEPVVEVYVPIRFAPGERPRGAFEVYMPYGPVAAAVADDTRTVVALLGGGLIVLWLGLFRFFVGASRRLRRQTLHDALTGLPNRTLLHERIEAAARAHDHDGSVSALLLIDLDHFKEVNDTLGHDRGDELLTEMAQRLRATVRGDDTLARLGGDEFGVLLPRLPNRAAAAELAARMQIAIQRPFAIGGIVVSLDASIGIALCPDHGRDPNVLLRRADVAMYQAKEGASTIETYDLTRDLHSSERLGLLGELRRAIDEDELELHFQPMVSVASREVTGVEALVRWRHPERGLLGPGEFVPAAERTAAIVDLTAWVLNAALSQCRAWREAGIDLPVAVNLASANVADLALPEVVAAALARHGLPGDRLACEISEHTVMADPARVCESLQRLRAMGVRIALDDFGTGQTSLSYLRRLPLDEIKIDRSFVIGMEANDGDAAIVRATIDLARNLGFGVVAEGVETRAALDRLGDLQCDVAQGFFLSRPLPADELDEWLRVHAGSVLVASAR